MVSNFQLLMIVGLVAGVAQTVYAHRCYTCVSDSGKGNCGENFKAEGNLDLDCTKTSMPRYLQSLLGFRNSTGCMKVVTESNNGQAIMRSCYYGDVHDTQRGCSPDPSISNIFSKQISCHVCTGDLCNGSTSITSMGVIALVTAYLVRHFCF